MVVGRCRRRCHVGGPVWWWPVSHVVDTVRWWSCRWPLSSHWWSTTPLSLSLSMLVAMSTTLRVGLLSLSLLLVAASRTQTVGCCHRPRRWWWSGGGGCCRPALAIAILVLVASSLSALSSSRRPHHHHPVVVVVAIHAGVGDGGVGRFAGGGGVVDSYDAGAGAVTVALSLSTTTLVVVVAAGGHCQ